MAERREDRIRKLARAIQVHIDHRARQEDVDGDELLAEHADLHELLEPMLAAGVDAAPTRGGERVLGDYRIRREVGRGGMGVVYEAEQISLGRRVALKVLPLRTAALSERARWRFQREARLAAQLDHPGIVKIHDFGVDDDLHYFAMEFVAGAPLSAVLDSARDTGLDTATGATVGAAVEEVMPEPGEGIETERGAQPDWNRGYVQTVVGLVAQVAEALEHAHRAGVIHRDVKPGNVLVRPDGTAVLADFGIARQEGLPSMTVTGDFAGTPYYVSPEQALGKPSAIDHRTDVFSLGVTLYELVTLKRPFDGDTTQEVLGRILAQEPLDPMRLNPALAPDLAAVILKALEKDVARRYASAADFAADLRAFLDYRPVTARRPTRWIRLRKWTRREPLKAALMGTVLAAAVVLIAVSGWFTRELLREGAVARDALANFNLLAYRVRLQECRAEALTFHPAWPELVPTMAQWLREDAEPLAAVLGELKEKLVEVRRQALPYDDLAASRDRQSHPEAARLALLESELLRMRAFVAKVAAGDAEPDPETPGYLERLQGELATVRARVHGRRSWRFEHVEDQFLHDQMAKLVDELGEFAEGENGALAVVREDFAWAKDLARRSLAEPADAWRAAIDDIARRPIYGGLRLSPQVGLVPLGVDPESGLWEFVHLRSGELGQEAPERAAGGRLIPSDGMGIVFVLVPGGSFEMGAQKVDPQAPHYDPAAENDESPVHEVSLAPFFIAKYELTQGQWRRLTRGEVPSLYRPDKPRGSQPHDITWHNPVESLPWDACDRVLRHHGLILPTEAQWEYSCRAGTDTPWSFGSDRSELPLHANLCDDAAARYTRWIPDRGLDDGHVVHAPVGSYEPNPWGLFDVHGNVFEWCRDFFGRYGARPMAEGDGMWEDRPYDQPFRMQRGGSFLWHAPVTRSADRWGNKPDVRESSYGVRAARAVLP